MTTVLSTVPGREPELGGVCLSRRPGSAVKGGSRVQSRRPGKLPAQEERRAGSQEPWARSLGAAGQLTPGASPSSPERGPSPGRTVPAPPRLCRKGLGVGAAGDEQTGGL